MRTLPSQLFVVAALAMALASPARADEPWTGTVQFATMSAPGLPDLVVLGVGELRRAVSPRFHLTLRLGGGFVSTDNETWNIAQTHVLAQVGGGIATTLGRATLSADAHVGALIISELDTRHQLQQLAQANVPDREQGSVATGPLGDIELAIDLRIVNRVSMRLSAGPQLTYISVDSELRLHGGFFGGVGVTYAF